MCPPVLAAVGLIASIGSSVAGTIGAMQSANAQASAAEAQANLQRRQASIEQTAGQQEALRKQEAADKMIGTQLSQYAGSGVTIEGSPTDVMADTRRETYLDTQGVIWNTNLKSENLRYGAAISDMNAKGYRDAAGMAAIGGVANAFGNIAKFGTSKAGTQLLSRF